MNTRGWWIAVLAAGMLAACGGDEDENNANGNANGSPNGNPNADTFMATWGMDLTAGDVTASAEGNFATCCLTGFNGYYESPPDGQDTGNWTVTGAPSDREEIEATEYSPENGSNFYFPGAARCVQQVGQAVTLTVTDAGPPAKGEFEATVRCTDTEDDSVVLAEDATVSGWFELFK